MVSSLRGGWKDSLLGALRHTRTHPGTRKLRATLLQVRPTQKLKQFDEIFGLSNFFLYQNIYCINFLTLLCQPLVEMSTINARLNAIQYLAENSELFYTLQVCYCL